MNDTHAARHDPADVMQVGGWLVCLCPLHGIVLGPFVALCGVDVCTKARSRRSRNLKPWRLRRCADLSKEQVLLQLMD